MASGLSYFERYDTAFSRFANGNGLLPIMLIALALALAWELVDIASR